MDDLEVQLQRFRDNRRKVADLINFDRTVLDFAIHLLEGVKRAQDLAGKAFTNPAHRVEKVITVLQNVRQEDALSVHYDTIHNQAIVLLVSYFAATLRDTYRATISRLLETEKRESLLREELRVTVADLLRATDGRGDYVSELFVEKRDLSFQDMKSTGRAFAELCGYERARDQVVNDIVVAQACRHVIVHAGEVATAQMLRQIASAVPRTIKLHIAEGRRIQFSPLEIDAAGRAMEEYLESLVEGIRTAAATS